MNRIDRFSYFVELAILSAQRGTCKRLRVGCVLVDDFTNRVVSIGYNSSFHSTPHCIDDDCLMLDEHCIRTLHAEQAAIMNLEHKYEKLKCFTTHQPCINCFKLLAAGNVKFIYYINPYIDEGRDLLNNEINLTMLQVESKELQNWKVKSKL
jgi:dCMP deaminase